MAFLPKNIASCIFLPLIWIAGHVHAEDEWTSLNREVEKRQSELALLMTAAGSENLNTDYAAVSMHVISTFREAARQDHDQVEKVREIFGTFGWLKDIASEEADNLAINELKACLEVADHAVSELQQQLQGSIILSPPPDLSSGTMELISGVYRLNGHPAFPSSLVWMPHDEGFMSSYGRSGGGYFQLSNLRQDESINPRSFSNWDRSISNQRARNTSPFVFLMGHHPAKWMTNQHPEIAEGARNFTTYDIDSPLIRSWMTELCNQAAPHLGKACGDQPMIHLLANEPHFATAKGGWLAKNGISKHTLEKYRRWVSNKYKKVEDLNATYGTNFTGFDTLDIEMPINPKLRGGPIWYDWCRFNMDRVNDWFSFLKQQVQSNDPNQSPVSIKLLGYTLPTSQRDHGMDIEFLTKLQDIPGADLRVAPQGATFFGKHETGIDHETSWQAHYAYDWVEQSMVLDFTKSLCPDKLFFDSEWHGFGAVSWRHFKMNRDYVRSALWMAFCDGMGMIEPWVWGRNDDGSLNPRTDHIGELSTQPIALDAFGRVMKELNAHADRVIAAVPDKRQFLIFYCEESAIQDADYMTHMKQVYESCKLLNVAVGFTTPAEIGKLEPKTQNLIITPTKFISDASLSTIQEYQRAKGRIVVLGSAGFFTKNELGAARTQDTPIKPFASLPIDPVSVMATKLEQALKPLIPEPILKLHIVDVSGSQAMGVINRQTILPDSGENSVILNNLSKDPRIVSFEEDNGPPIKVIDAITGQTISGPLRMEPCDLRVLSIQENKQLVPAQ